MSLTLTQLGGLALFEDLGRSGYADLGVSPSGAANRSALARANLAVGNAPGAPALEIIGTCRLLAHRSAILALAGAPAAVMGGEQQRSADGTLVIAVAAGEEISLRPHGIRTYIAVRGGFEVPRVLGSASHDTLSGLGPPPLREGDVLAIGRELLPLRTINPDHASSPPAGAPAALLLASVYPGPRANWVDNLDALFDNEYRVSDLADRIGIRLRGPRIARTRQEELPSEGIVRGAIQIPPSGEPLVFGPDHPNDRGLSRRWGPRPCGSGCARPRCSRSSDPFPPRPPAHGLEPPKSAREQYSGCSTTLLGLEFSKRPTSMPLSTAFAQECAAFAQECAASAREYVAPARARAVT